MRQSVVIWETPAAKSRNRTPVLVVECKAEKVDINIKDYYQGESYARAAGCEFFIAHNARYTEPLRVYRRLESATCEVVRMRGEQSTSVLKPHSGRVGDP